MCEVEDLRAELQTRRDLLFLGALLLLVVASAFTVVRSAYPPHRDYRTAAGEIRAVNPAVLRRLLRSGRLSDREAEHYRRVGADPQSAPGGERAR